MEERRGTYRYKVNLAGSVATERSPPLPIRVVNISLSGLMAKIAEPIPSPRRVTLQVDLAGVPFEAEAVCVRTTYDGAPYEAAFLFTRTGGEALDRLYAYLANTGE